MCEPSKPEEIRPAADTLPIAAREIKRLASTGPIERWEDAIDATIVRARDLIEPRGRFVELESIEGLVEQSCPVSAIAQAGERCWAFVVTIGDALETQVKELMASHQYLEGVLLDAAGSTAVEAVADEIETLVCGDSNRERFSPGYCAWSMRGQKPLFALLDPARLGITLLPSMLMQPLKSVSGIIVRADEEILRVPPATCANCNAQGCSRRQARYSC